MTKRTRQKLIILLLTAAALAAILIPALLKRSVYASVEYSGEEIMRIDLSEDGVYSIEGDLPVTLRVEDGGIRFENSVCPDHICEDFGLISKEGESAICVPARVAVYIRH